MYVEYDKKGVPKVIALEEDQCFTCMYNADCALVQGLHSGILTFTEPYDNIHVTDCIVYCKKTKHLKLVKE